MKNKMKLWDNVCKTDMRYTKDISYGKRSFTTINAQHQLQNATEVFGPYGIGFGVKEETFNIIEGLVLYQAELWYKIDDSGGTFAGQFPIHSSASITRGGKLDDDFAKKVATDALTKGLSKLGFNADIFLGQYDDNKYVNKSGATKTKRPVSVKDQAEAKKNGFMTKTQEDKLREMIQSHHVSDEERTTTEGWLADPQGHSKKAASDAIEKLSGMIQRRSEEG